MKTIFLHLTLILVAILLVALPSLATADDGLAPRAEERQELKELFEIAAAHQKGHGSADDWERLFSAANDAVDEEVPRVTNTDLDHYSSEFEAWAKEEGLSLDEAAYYALIGRGMRVKALAFAKDERAIPVFLRALEARDTLVTTSAVAGLVFLEHTEGIPAIERAYERDPDLGKIFGAFLLALDDQAARDAARKMINDPEQLASLKKALEDDGKARVLFRGEINRFELNE